MNIILPESIAFRYHLNGIVFTINTVKDYFFYHELTMVVNKTSLLFYRYILRIKLHTVIFVVRSIINCIKVLFYYIYEPNKSLFFTAVFQVLTLYCNILRVSLYYKLKQASFTMNTIPSKSTVSR